jgi:hypothetical protein
VLGDVFNALVDPVAEPDQVHALAEELLDAARQVDQLTSLNVAAHVSSTLARVAQRHDDVSSARSYAQSALRTVREHGFMVWTADCIEILAWVADRIGLGERAARLFGACVTEAERQGIVGYVEHIEHEARHASTRAVLGEEAWTAAYVAGRELLQEEAIAEALTDGGG